MTVLDDEETRAPEYVCTGCDTEFDIPGAVRHLVDLDCPECGAGYSYIRANREPRR